MGNQGKPLRRGGIWVVCWETSVWAFFDWSVLCNNPDNSLKTSFDFPLLYYLPPTSYPRISCQKVLWFLYLLGLLLILFFFSIRDIIYVCSFKYLPGQIILNQSLSPSCLRSSIPKFPTRLPLHLSESELSSTMHSLIPFLPSFSTSLSFLFFPQDYWAPTMC